jgi:hypothetical protein
MDGKVTVESKIKTEVENGKNQESKTKPEGTAGAQRQASPSNQSLLFRGCPTFQLTGLRTSVDSILRTRVNKLDEAPDQISHVKHASGACIVFLDRRLRERSQGSEYHVPFPLPCCTR